MLRSAFDDGPSFLEDLLLNNPSMESVALTEEISSPSQQDGNGLESYYENDIEGMSMSWGPDQLMRDLLDETPSIDQYSMFGSVIDDLSELLTESGDAVRSTESDDIDAPIQSASDERLAMIKTSPSTLPVTRTQKSTTKPSPITSIPLSRSVAVTDPKTNRLQLVHQLEDAYRPRYKSDYFPSKGPVRSPRYVSDNAGHHYVTLQIPAEYPRDVKKEWIRVALLTTSVAGQGHFYSPYKFQRDNDNVNVSDENPIYIPVQTYRESDLTIRLHLVLIKSKLDQLNHAQPLTPFSNTAETVQNIIPSAKLTPKELISKYQLDKSHIAFTLCSMRADGGYDIHPETMVISSVITEAPSKTAGASASQPEPATVSSGKEISCPNCSHCFQLTEGDESPTKRKKMGKASTDDRAAKRKK